MEQKRWEEHYEVLQRIAENTIYRWLSEEEIEMVTQYTYKSTAENYSEQDIKNIILHVTKNEDEDCYGEY
jgi:ATP-dependent Clp protease ATP-binding subunit ClpA